MKIMKGRKTTRLRGRDRKYLEAQETGLNMIKRNTNNITSQ